MALSLRMPSEIHAYSLSWNWCWIVLCSSNSLANFDASPASLATQVWNFKYKFHIGKFIAWPVKILWLFLSLLPSSFVILDFICD